MPATPKRICDLSLAELRQRCRHNRLEIDYGAAVVRVQCRIQRFIPHLRQVYGAFHATDHPFADYHVRLNTSRGWRALLRPQSRFLIDGVEPFAPFPRDNALPLFEWGVNWCFAQRFNQYVLLHAGVLAQQDRAVIMAAPPGSGKSTLAAAMMLRGFRLLSDEFGVLCPELGRLHAMLKPVALKNQSVAVIRDFAPEAVIGPLFTGTRKGDVAHLAPNTASVDAIHRPARPALVIFPAYTTGAELTIRRLPQEQAFARLAFNSFNYELLGSLGFEAVAEVIATSPAYELRYSQLDAAIAQITQLLAEAQLG